MCSVHDVCTDKRTVLPSVYMKRERGAASVVVRKVGVLEQKYILVLLELDEGITIRRNFGGYLPTNQCHISEDLNNRIIINNKLVKFF